jgi:predicted nucleotidyltransferase
MNDKFQTEGLSNLEVIFGGRKSLKDMKNEMTENSIYLKLKTIKPNYLKDGFEILGIFGSFSSSEEKPDSDLDILYRSMDKLEETYPGWLIFSYIDQVRQELETQFDRKVDLVDMDALNEVGRKYILAQVKYV